MQTSRVVLMNSSVSELRVSIPQSCGTLKLQQ